MNNNEAIKLLQDAADWADAMLEMAEIVPTDARAIVRLLKEHQESTTFENDGHHIRCTNCGEYWCKTDIEGNKFPDRFCPNCGRKVKW